MNTASTMIAKRRYAPSLFCSALSILFFVTLAGADPYTQSSGTVSKTGQAYTASNQDESGVLVTGGEFTLSDSTVTTTGNTSSGDNSSFYGQNAGVLAKSGGKINLSGCTITTSGTGANGVFAYYTGSTVTMTDCTVYCSGQLAHGIMASGGGTLTATNVDITTLNRNAAPIATDRGGGTITVTGGTMIASGADSPGIYSTGVISVTSATIEATGSEGAVLEGKNTITLTDTNLSGGQTNYGGVLLMQSMSGDSDIGTASFIMDGGTLTAPNGSLFFITNTTATITLTGVSASATSGTLLTACATDRWGTTGSNGGLVTLTADEQTLAGNVAVDSISTFSGALQNGSTLTGAINAANTGQSVSLALDAASTWTVTADSYLSSLSDSDGISGTSVTNIIGNGNNVFYDPDESANSYLDSQIYSLVNGGYLAPVGAEIIDTDEDGLLDSIEEELGTEPDNADTDGDGLSDGYEVSNGLDPLDPSDAARIDLPAASCMLMFLAMAFAGMAIAWRRRKA